MWINSSYNVFLPSSCPMLHLCLPQLAQHGMNVVIISRSRADLDVVAKEISKKKKKIILLRDITFELNWSTVANTGPALPFLSRWNHREKCKSDRGRLDKQRRLWGHWGRTQGSKHRSSGSNFLLCFINKHREDHGMATLFNLKLFLLP